MQQYQSSKPFVFKYRVLYGDCDQMGIVYHPNYLKYLELGRIEFLRSFGYSYAEMERNGIRIPVLRIEADYRQSARFDDVLLIETTMQSISRIRISFAYRICNAANEALILNGKSEHAFTNSENKPWRVEQSFVETLLMKA